MGAIGAAHNQTVRHEEDSVMPINDDYDDGIIDEESMFTNNNRR